MGAADRDMPSPFCLTLMLDRQIHLLLQIIHLITVWEGLRCLKPLLFSIYALIDKLFDEAAIRIGC